MPKKKQIKPNDKEQSARFIETAERILADDADERFEEAIKRILPAKKKPEEKPL